MSELRVALVAEGPTDGIVVGAALTAILGDRPYVLTQLQPEGSVVFGSIGPGWVGAYRWCKQSASRGAGRLSGDTMVFQNFDILILHCDADVADKSYAHGSITPDDDDGALPCAQSCPPVEATTNRLRRVMLSWCGETVPPANTVLCVPSKNSEAWVLATLFPGDSAVRPGLECLADPQLRLAQQPIKSRIRKRVADYRKHSNGIANAWPRIAAPGQMVEAHRFECDVLAVVTP